MGWFDVRQTQELMKLNKQLAKQNDVCVNCESRHIVHYRSKSFWVVFVMLFFTGISFLMLKMKKHSKCLDCGARWN